MAAPPLSGKALGVIELVKGAAHDLRARKNGHDRRLSKAGVRTLGAGEPRVVPERMESRQVELGSPDLFDLSHEVNGVGLGHVRNVGS